MSRCAIGICAAIERARWGPWEDMVTMLPRSYANAVQAAGGLALLLPPDEAGDRGAGPLLDRIDALILAGGSDIDPATYGAAPHPETGGTWPERDRFEIALARGALEREMPLLGVCRGMEILNVALGGSLVQHLPDAVGGDEHRHTPARSSTTRSASSRARSRPRAGRSAATRAHAKSHHHQGVDELGEGLRGQRLVGAPTIWSRRSSSRGHRFALGVLWHPEEEDEASVIASLVEAARSEVGLK